MKTLTMRGSAGFRDAGYFPFDPADFAAMRKIVTDDKVYIYFRGFFDGTSRSMLLGSPPSMFQAKTLSTQEEEAIVHLVYEHLLAARLQDAVVAVKDLCEQNLPQIQNLREVPRENVIGVILVYRDRRLIEHCYCNFALDDVPSMTATIH